MVAEPWIHKMRTALSLQNYYSSSSSTVGGPRKKKEGSKPSQDGEGTVGILCFEVANAMSRAVNLYRSLSDSEIARLRSQTLASPAVRLLVSTNEPYLLALALAEKLDDLNRVAAVASRLGRRCSHPALRGFEHVYFDVLAGRIDPASLGSLSKDMDGTVRKMERFVSSAATLYIELEVLTQLEHSARKCPRCRSTTRPAGPSSRRSNGSDRRAKHADRKRWKTGATFGRRTGLSAAPSSRRSRTSLKEEGMEEERERGDLDLREGAALPRGILPHGSHMEGWTERDRPGGRGRAGWRGAGGRESKRSGGRGR